MRLECRLVIVLSIWANSSIRTLEKKCVNPSTGDSGSGVPAPRIAALRRAE